MSGPYSDTVVEGLGALDTVLAVAARAARCLGAHDGQCGHHGRDHDDTGDHCWLPRFLSLSLSLGLLDDCRTSVLSLLPPRGAHFILPTPWRESVTPSAPLHCPLGRLRLRVRCSKRRSRVRNVFCKEQVRDQLAADMAARQCTTFGQGAQGGSCRRISSESH